jgi:hypothetical protein
LGKVAHRAAQNCFATTQVIADAAVRARAYASCIDACNADTLASLRQCHDTACGQSGWYCFSPTPPNSPFAEPSVCCPRGTRMARQPDGSRVCTAGCGFACAPPLVLYQEFCVCACNPSTSCGNGTTLDLKTCQCV